MVIAACDAFASFLTGQRYYLAMMKPTGFMVPKEVASEDVYDLPDPEKSGVISDQRELSD